MNVPGSYTWYIEEARGARTGIHFTNLVLYRYAPCNTDCYPHYYTYSNIIKDSHKHNLFEIIFHHSLNIFCHNQLRVKVCLLLRL